MICTDHQQEFRAPFACPVCAPGQAEGADDPAGDADLRTAIADGLPGLRGHEKWCLSLSDEARKLATVHSQGDSGPSACGPAYLRVALSARIEAARMAENRERRAWILEVERARKASGATAPSSPPSRRVPQVGEPIRPTRERAH